MCKFYLGVYIIPRLDDILDKLHASCIFFKLNFKIGYHYIIIREVYEWKTYFKTNEGLFE